MKRNRRHFLKAAGVSLLLPRLESFAETAGGAPPMRLFVVHAHLGFYPPDFWPKNAGADYELPRSLQPLTGLRDDFTLIQGMRHPGVKGGHGAALQVLTGTPSGAPKNGVSIDQLIAEKTGLETRYPSIQMGFGSVSINRSGVKLPGWGSAPDVYKRLFMTGNPRDVEKTVARLREGRSILDAVRDQARRVEHRVSAQDREKLGEYFSSVREVEQRLLRAESWADKPAPAVPIKPGQIQDIDGEENLRQYVQNWGDLARLAIQTDSSRVICWDLAMNNNLAKLGFAKTWHGLTHTEKERWGDFDVLLFRELAGLIQGFKDTKEGDGSLLDRTMILFTSPLGNAGNHSNHNMPALLAGGGFRHGRHLITAGDTDTPYSNLFVTLMQKMGLDTDRFATSTGPLRELG